MQLIFTIGDLLCHSFMVVKKKVENKYSKFKNILLAGVNENIIGPQLRRPCRQLSPILTTFTRTKSRPIVQLVGHLLLPLPSPSRLPSMDRIASTPPRRLPSALLLQRVTGCSARALSVSDNKQIYTIIALTRLAHHLSIVTSFCVHKYAMGSWTYELLLQPDLRGLYVVFLLRLHDQRVRKGIPE